MKKTALLIILLFSAATFVSAQQKQRIAVLPSIGDLDPQRLILLTDKVREIATKNLPIDNFNILKQDVITKMIGEEELYRSCKEGVCIGDLAKKTNANYGARCDVVKLDDRLVLKFELYSVNEEAIFETFTDYDIKDFYGMLAVLEARLPDAFKKMLSVSERDKAREQQQQETKAQAAEEYKPPPYVAQQPKPHKKASPTIVTLRVAGAAAGGVGLIGWLVANESAKEAFGEYNAADENHVTDARKNVKGKIGLRNTMLGIAGVGLCGFAVSLFF